VLTSFLEILWWLQPESTGGATGGSGGGGGEGVAASPSGCASQAGLLIVMMAIFYFLLIRPQQKRQKEHDSMLKALKKGSIVRTNGGIRGEIFSLSDKDAMVIVADKVKINVLRSHISAVEPEAGEEKKDEAKG